MSMLSLVLLAAVTINVPNPSGEPAAPMDETPIASKVRGWQLSSSIGVGFTSSSYRPEDQTGVSQTTLTNLDAPPAFYGEIAALYRTTYFSYGASLSAQYNRLNQESAYYELNYTELPLVLALRLGVHPYDDRLSIYAGAGAAFVMSTTELTSSVIELDKSASTTSIGPALTSGVSYALTPAHALSLTWTHTFSDDANISATNFGWTYTFGKE